jgi:hypothetical protein
MPDGWSVLGGFFTGDTTVITRDNNGNQGIGIQYTGNAIIARGYSNTPASRMGPSTGHRPSQTQTTMPHTAIVGNRGTRS